MKMFIKRTHTEPTITQNSALYLAQRARFAAATSRPRPLSRSLPKTLLQLTEIDRFKHSTSTHSFNLRPSLNLGFERIG
jgi:hypothetical protein